MQDLENDGPRMRWMPTYTALNTTGSSTAGVYPCVVKCDNKQVEVDTGMADAHRIQHRIETWRPNQKCSVPNDVQIKSCIERYGNGTYSRLQFLQAVSQSGCLQNRGFPGDV